MGSHVYNSHFDDIRVRLLADCDRYDFAKSARYKIPNRGEGFTIRFVERTIALMGNIYAPSYVIYEDDERRTIRATVIDLERNVTWERDVTIQKTVERQESKGREVVRMRQKADGGIIAIVRGHGRRTVDQGPAIQFRRFRLDRLRRRMRGVAFCFGKEQSCLSGGRGCAPFGIDCPYFRRYPVRRRVRHVSGIACPQASTGFLAQNVAARKKLVALE